jgi:uncharacterized protein YecE (DUF72 family)
VKEISDFIKIGTCSWKYPSWKGILYSEKVDNNFLAEYARHYNTVEIDQWFWSLFPGNKVVLPDPKVVYDYVSSVPENFQFSIKVPNAITLTHHYSHSKNKNSSLIKNPFFLSPELFSEFLDLLHPMQNNIAAFIFQFEYLNKQKMPSQNIFQEKFLNFIKKCPSGLAYSLEIRNPKYLNEDYFSFLKSNHLSHVFLQGYYMPPIFDVYEKYHDLLESFLVIRLLGRDRKGIEDKSQGNWSKLLDPKDEELDCLAKMMHDLMIKNIRLFINVNNHYEGSAPLTIDRLISRFNTLKS